MLTKNIAESGTANLSDDFLLRTIVDEEFRNELLATPNILDNTLGMASYQHDQNSTYDEKLKLQFPYLVEQQDITFAQLLEDILSDISAMASSDSNNCRCTCVSGLTWKCDGCSF
jgi:Family of unknown function (DUF5973)